jgi:hypothetical protein
LLIQNHGKDKEDSMRRIEVLLGVTVLTLGFLSIVPGIRATEPLGGANGNGVGEKLLLIIRANEATSYVTKL